MRPRSRAEEAAITALFDIGEVIERSGCEPERFRLIGGQMVSLLALSRGLAPQLQRMSLDADFGAHAVTIQGASLHAQLTARGYAWDDGRYVRPLGDGVDAVIDLLVPAYTSRRKQTKLVDGRRLFEVQGLANVLNLPGVALRLRAHDDARATTLVVPDERGALLVKTHAWLDRFADKDAIDVWRCLELCVAAGVTGQSWSGAYEPARAQLVGPLLEHFGSPTGRGCVELARHDAAQPTRTMALARRVVG
ncbi:MAG: hypothetical protein H6713_32780 [Myxococcales bacterium]|nr:hypothetical protein [Myxococcales bacterium]